MVTPPLCNENRKIFGSQGKTSLAGFPFLNGCAAQFNLFERI